MNARDIIERHLRTKGIDDGIWYTVCSHYIDTKPTTVLDDFVDEKGKHLMTVDELQSEMIAFNNYYHKLHYTIDWKYVHELEDIDSLIKEFEDLTELELPLWFIFLMKRYNNGRPSLNTIDVSGTERIIKKFLSFEKDIRDSIWNYYDANYVPFAIDNFGNIFCLNNSDNGITFINHETSEKNLVCNSFIDFIALLK